MAETTIDIEKLKEDGNILHHYFQSDNVCDHGRYDTKKVLYIAFLHCKHPKRSTQERALWGIINPQLNESISHEEAAKFFEDLAMIAIDLPLNHCQQFLNNETKRVLEELGEEGKIEAKIEEAYTNAINYLKNCKQQAIEKVRTLTEALGTEIRSAQLFTLAVSDLFQFERQLTKGIFFAFKKLWFTSSGIRAFINPEEGKLKVK